MPRLSPEGLQGRRHSLEAVKFFDTAAPSYKQVLWVRIREWLRIETKSKILKA